MRVPKAVLRTATCRAAVEEKVLVEHPRFLPAHVIAPAPFSRKLDSHTVVFGCPCPLGRKRWQPGMAVFAP